MIGERIQDLRTPALLVDLDTVDENIGTMSRQLHGRRAKLRPHFKNHRSLALAQLQMQAGAIGLTVARLRHAQLLLEAGVPSVLISNELVSRAELRLLAELSAQFSPAQEILAVVDHPSVVRELGRASSLIDHPLSVLVDVDLGLERTGVQPSEAIALVDLVVNSGLRFKGLFGYEGHVQRLPPGLEKANTCAATLEVIATLSRQLRLRGTAVDIVSTSGTGSLEYATQAPEITEVQAGSYLLMETGYEKAAPQFKTSLTVLATIISKTDRKRVIVDAGLKALSAERGMPEVKNVPGVRLRVLHAEHGVLDLVDPSAEVQVGDRIEIWVQYGDATVNLHRCMYGCRDGRVEQVLEIEA